MAYQVKSAKEATTIATNFLKQYYAFTQPKSASKDNDIWVVEVDVGVLMSEIAQVRIDASTADVIGYSFPE